jgi:squalene-hopene/tetraprenyl-beta-curcumene cyclase
MTGEPALDRTISRLTTRLLERRTSSGYWEGYLASSALSTATAAIALILDEAATGRAHARLIEAAVEWLIAKQNNDGGWGDTIISTSNLSTTALCWSALSLITAGPNGPALPTAFAREPLAQTAIDRAEGWLRANAGDLRPKTLTRAILDAYGRDRTFSAPILTVLALAGRLGPDSDGWRLVPQLPFELAACPHQCFEWLRLPVVSYALPALVAIGQARHHHRPTRNFPLAAIRSALRKKTLRIARSMQPESGGYLEATPLTSFVVMSLITSGNAGHPIVESGVRFLTRSVRADGSWPIDTNLAIWVTTLSIDALEPGDELREQDKKRILEWLLAHQVPHEHPFTHAKPGGWAWTNLSGGVPDADDTAGALLAIWKLGGANYAQKAIAGIDWLMDLQNRDGGIPTFCRGWGALPFDRSAPDITAHALQAWSAWRVDTEPNRQRRIFAVSERAVSYLARCQRRDGSWAPLWFGNERMPGHVNLTYGTSCVIAALTAPLVRDLLVAARSRDQGMRWLLRAQNSDGGWGAGASPSSIEETGLALHALAVNVMRGTRFSDVKRDDVIRAVSGGVRWLIAVTEEGQQTPPSPIGLYFARLWYFEELYPVIFGLRGLSRARALLACLEGT